MTNVTYIDKYKRKKVSKALVKATANNDTPAIFHLSMELREYNKDRFSKMIGKMTDEQLREHLVKFYCGTKTDEEINEALIDIRDRDKAK